MSTGAARGAAETLARGEFNALLDVLADAIAARINPKFADGVVHRRLLTLDQAAGYLGRTREAVQHMVTRKKIPVVRADRRIFLDIADLDAWVRENKS